MGDSRYTDSPQNDNQPAIAVRKVSVEIYTPEMAKVNRILKPVSDT
jgi:hypothetical protein